MADPGAEETARTTSLFREVALSIGRGLHASQMLQDLLMALGRACGIQRGAAWLFRERDKPYPAAVVGSFLPAGPGQDGTLGVLSRVLCSGRAEIKSDRDAEFAAACGGYTGGEKEVLLFPVGERLVLQIVFGRTGAANDVRRVLRRLAPRIQGAVAACLTYEATLARLETRYRQVVDRVNAGIYWCTLDGRVMEANPAFAAMFGFKDTEGVLRTPAADLYANPRDRERFLERLLVDGSVSNYEILYKRRDGCTFWGSDTAALVEVAGGDPQVMGVITDISDRKALEQRLRESEERYRVLAESSQVGVYMVQDGLFRYVNPALASMFGYRPEEMVDRIGITDIVHPEDRGVFGRDERQTAAWQGGSSRWIVRGLRKDGRTIICEVMESFSNYSGRACTLGSVMDITERKTAEAKMEFLSTHDVLTGLYNRAFFDSRVQALKDDPAQYPMVVVMADVNRLKSVNDSMGHYFGDQVLRAAGDVFKTCFRSDDLVARIGGDEFAIVLPRTTREESEEIAARVYRAVEERNRAAGEGEPVLRMAVGTAVAEWPDSPLDEALRAADANMYVNKEAIEESAPGPLVTVLLSSLAERDLETREHMVRVKELALRLAAARTMGESSKAILATLALVHDVGKIGLPDRILLKRGCLLASERTAMQRHVEIGYRIARSTPQLAFVADYILHHHERWDGTGYPKGLKGDEIPLHCRILAIVDAYDAMTSPRPYRPAPMNAGEALDEIRRFAGVQFDPGLAHLFVSIMEC